MIRSRLICCARHDTALGNGLHAHSPEGVERNSFDKVKKGGGNTAAWASLVELQGPQPQLERAARQGVLVAMLQLDPRVQHLIVAPDGTHARTHARTHAQQ